MLGVVSHTGRDRILLLLSCSVFTERPTCTVWAVDNVINTPQNNRQIVANLIMMDIWWLCGL